MIDFGLGLQYQRIGTALRLGHHKAGGHVVRGQRFQEALLLLLGSVMRQNFRITRIGSL